MEQSKITDENIEAIDERLLKLRKTNEDIVDCFYHWVVENENNNNIDDWIEKNKSLFEVFCDTNAEVYKLTSIFKKLNKNLEKNKKRIKNQIARQERERMINERKEKTMLKQKRNEPSKYLEYNKEYAKMKTKETKHCDYCNEDITYYSWSKHLTRLKHLKNMM